MTCEISKRFYEQYCFFCLDPAPLNCFLENATEFEQFLRSNLSLSDRVVRGIMSSTIDRTQVGVASSVTSLMARVGAGECGIA